MTKINSGRSCVSVVLSLAFLGVCGQTKGAIHTWQGPANGNWSVAANWDTGVPTSGESGGTVVAFGSGASSVCNMTVTVDLIHFTGTGSTVAGDNSHVLTVSGAVLTNNIVNDSGTNTLGGASGATTLPVTLSGANCFVSVPTGTLTFTANFGGGVGMAFFGPGTSVLASAVNTFTGAATVNSGTLELNSGGTSTAIPGTLVIGQGVGLAGSAVLRLLSNQQIADTSPVTIGSDGVLDLNGNWETVATLTGNGSLVFGVSAIPGNSGELDFGDATNFAFAGTLSGRGFLFKLGTGTMTFTGTNLNTGNFVVGDGELDLNSVASPSTWPGTLQVGNGSGAANSARVVMLANSQLNATTQVGVSTDGLLNMNNFSTSTGKITFYLGLGTTGTLALGSGTVTMAGDLAMDSGSITATTGTLNLGGNILVYNSPAGSSISAKVTLNGTRTITELSNSSTLLTISGVISNGTQVSGILKTGPGTLALTGSANTFTGITTVDQGLMTMNASVLHSIEGPLVIGNNVDVANSAIVRELQSSDLPSTISVQINASGEFDLNTHSDTIEGLTGTGNLALNSGGSLAVGFNSTNSTFNGTVSGNGVLDKTGGGTFTLAGQSPGYTGTAIAAGGTLQVNGVLNPAGSAVNVTALGTLGGRGEVGAINVTAAGGTIAPGGSPLGVLTSGAANLSSGILAIGIDDAEGQMSDEISTSQNLNISGATLNVSVTGTPTQNAYILGTYGSLTGTFAAISGVPPGYSLNYAYSDDNALLHIALVVPGFVTTSAASSITASSARLNGTINPHGKTTQWYFQYGLTTFYGSKSPLGPGLTGSSVVPVSALISGLNGGRTYHFQLVAVNSGGPSYGADATFSTPGPLVTTGGAAPVAALSATLAGTANPRGTTATAWFEYGLTTSYGSKSTVQNLGSGNAGVPVSKALTGLSFGKIYHYRLVSTNADGTSRGDDATCTTLTVLPPIIAAVGQPTSAMVTITGAASFTVTATEGSPVPTDSILTYQWYKNGAPVAGATAHTCTISPASLSQAGTYTCGVKNAAGGTTSGGAELGVVDASVKNLHVAAGSSTSIIQSAAGNQLSYQWYKDSNAITGAVANPLSLNTLQAADDGVYLCVIHGPGGTLAGGTTNLAVYDAHPVILTPVVLPEAIVGGTYQFQIPIDPSDNVAPTGFSATGLPAGLTVNAAGLISGRIPAPLTTDTSYTVTMKAFNSKGSSPAASAILLVHTFPKPVVGTYNGLVDRDALPLGGSSINAGLGGTVTLTVTSAGSYTGKITLGAASYPLSGVFLANIGSSVVNATAVITQPPPLHKLALTFAIDGSTGYMNGSVADNIAVLSVAMNATINPWKAVANPAPLAATYTAEIQNSGFNGTDPGSVPPGNPANVAYPQGNGYATVIVTPGGGATWAGRMADGTGPATVYATTMGISGSIPFHLLLPANAGSVHGAAVALADGTPNTNGGLPILAGVLNWYKKGPFSGTDRTYASGIPLYNLNIMGGKYVAPAPGTPVLGLSITAPGTNNAKLVFTEGGLTGPAPITPAVMAASLNRPLRITTGNTADFSTPGGNSTGLSLTLNATTGAMSGSFTLVDGLVSRPVTFHGVLVPRLSIKMGVGYFLLPELPTPATTPILSGMVKLEAGP